jgi:DNA-binding NarL/FixJ family response regulator
MWRLFEEKSVSRKGLQKHINKKESFGAKQTVKKSSASHCTPLTTSIDFIAEYYKLTSKEEEVVKLISNGHNRNEVAKALRLDPREVERYRDDLLKKLKLSKEEEISLLGNY